jgi:hypothetical protein
MSEWIEWKGGECPVDAEKSIMVRLRGGVETDASVYLTGVLARRYGADQWMHQTMFGGIGDIVAYRIVESAPEAHMMAAPAEYCPMCAAAGAHINGCPNDPITVREPGVQVDTVTITRDEYAELVAFRSDAGHHFPAYTPIMAERDALRAEVERLRTINASLATQVSSAEIEVATVYERLRKGKDDEQKCDRSHMVGEARPDFPKHPQAPSLAMVADTLDHRLGTPQPDGEPCSPMSARRWRWLP